MTLKRSCCALSMLMQVQQLLAANGRVDLLQAELAAVRGELEVAQREAAELAAVRGELEVAQREAAEEARQLQVRG